MVGRVEVLDKVEDHLVLDLLPDLELALSFAAKFCGNIQEVSVEIEHIADVVQV